MRPSYSAHPSQKVKFELEERSPDRASCSPAECGPTARPLARAAPDGIEWFAEDLSEHEQTLVSATQGAPNADLFNQKVEGTAWRSSWYIVTNNDRAIQPEL